MRCIDRKLPRALTGTLALLGALSVPLAAQGAQPPAGGNQIKLKAPAPGIVLFGASSVLAGQLTGQANRDQTVTLQQDVFPFGDGVTTVAATKTDAKGNFSFTRSPGKNTNFRVLSKGVTAATALRVRPRVALRVSDSTPSAGQMVTFSGTVRPQHDGLRILIQRQASTGAFGRRAARARSVFCPDWPVAWRTVLQTATGNVSTFKATLRVPSAGNYRAVLLSHGDHVTGYSTVRTLTTH